MPINLQQPTSKPLPHYHIYHTSHTLNTIYPRSLGVIQQQDDNIIMSGEQYTRKIEECRRQLNTLKKDINYRNEQVTRNELTYALDAEIRGQFPQIDDQLAVLRAMLANFEGKAKEMSLMPREVEKRRNALQVNVDERDKLKHMYDDSLARVAPNSAHAKATNDMNKFNNEYKKPMDKAELLALKQKQQQKQDEAIDDLIGVVRHMKTGGNEIKQELNLQDGLLNNLDAGLDQNTEKMSKVRRNLGKLMDSSSYSCLVLVIILEIAGIVCNLLLWHK